MKKKTPSKTPKPTASSPVSPSQTDLQKVSADGLELYDSLKSLLQQSITVASCATMLTPDEMAQYSEAASHAWHIAHEQNDALAHTLRANNMYNH